MLTDQEHAILAFEEHWIDRPAGARELAIFDTFGWRLPRHQQVLGRMLERQDVIAAAPQLVYRLLARRERRLAARAARLAPRPVRRSATYSPL
jgi:hypothetical protein